MAVDKHINFFELTKAAEKPGCPLCRIVTDRAERYIDNMLFEHVSDRGFRALHRQAGGFCAFHSRHLESFRDGLAVAILGRDILEDRIGAFENHRPWRPQGHCPVCLERDRIEEEYLSFLAQCGVGREESPEERELRETFTASAGLCAPHYARLLEVPRRKESRFRRDGEVHVYHHYGRERLAPRLRPIPRWLKEFQENKFRELLRRTSQFIELSAYGRQEEFALLSEADQVVWKELASILRGEGAS